MTTTLPAEWAPQSAVILTWPNEDGDFSRSYVQVEQNFFEIARAISRFQPVWINREEQPMVLHRRLVDFGVAAGNLKILPVGSDDVWARDHGPITVVRSGAGVHLDFTFNGWGGKFEAVRDNQVTRNMATLGGLPYPVETIDFVLEGGAIDSDGAGTLLTTAQCLLTPTRNPLLNQSQIEVQLKERLGLDRILWLTRGGLAGDDTDSHVDTLARFCDETTIAYQACDDRMDRHYLDLATMASELAGFRTRQGDPYRLVPLPLPAPILSRRGRRLPASYANFLIINGAVLVPTYRDTKDIVALERLTACFPEREVIGIDCRALIEQYGSLHCVTMQVPDIPSA